MPLHSRRYDVIDEINETIDTAKEKELKIMKSSGLIKHFLCFAILSALIYDVKCGKYVVKRVASCPANVCCNGNNVTSQSGIKSCSCDPNYTGQYCDKRLEIAPVIQVFGANGLQGSNIAINCFLITTNNGMGDVSTTVNFTWVIDDKTVSANSSLSIVNAPTSSELKLLSIAYPSPYQIAKCIAANKIGSTSAQINITVIAQGSSICQSDNYKDVVWQISRPTSTTSQKCPYQAIGTATRRCIYFGNNSHGWEEPNFLNCIRGQLMLLNSWIKNSSSSIRASAINQIINSLGPALTYTKAMPLLTGDLNTATNIIQGLSSLATNYSATQSMSIATAVQNIINADNANGWSYITKQANSARLATLIQSLNDIGLKTNFSGQSLAINKNTYHSYIQSTNANTSVITIPYASSTTQFLTTTSLSFNDNLFAANNVIKITKVAASKFSSLQNLWPVVRTDLDSSIQLSAENELAMLSEVVSATTLPKISNTTLSNIYINYQHFQTNVTISTTSIICAYFNITSGKWNNKTCSRVKDNVANPKTSRCDCNAFGVYGLLYIKPKQIISPIYFTLPTTFPCFAVGIGGSLVTLIIHIVLAIRSRGRKSISSINLCFTTFAASILIIVGPFLQLINVKVNWASFCLPVAITTHDLALIASMATIVEVHFHMNGVINAKSKVNELGLVLLSYGIPGMIVGPIAGAFSRIYVNPQTCWLSNNNNLSLTFLVPVAVFAFVALVVYFVSIYKYYASTTKYTRKNISKHIILLLILMISMFGAYIITGLNYRQKLDEIFFYIFDVLIALQGITLFILCIFTSLKYDVTGRNRDSLRIAETKNLDEETKI
ncbi:Brain-specific angiogenesis inhibitor 1 [Trichoplax sp. H2]|nr:Brain-specific angiogenesis inhibitor 1 [Trichoplax sp. H2]|eukprot:RDD37728.1 Brain-specific angiogenesis inhibitor 1 [Trichoplax sp. H2]